MTEEKFPTRSEGTSPRKKELVGMRKKEISPHIKVDISSQRKEFFPSSTQKKVEVTDRKKEQLISRRATEIASRRKEQISPRRIEETMARRKEQISPRRTEETTSRRKEQISPRRIEETMARRKEQISPRRTEETTVRRKEQISPRRKEETTARRKEQISPRRKEEISSHKREDVRLTKYSRKTELTKPSVFREQTEKSAQLKQKLSPKQKPDLRESKVTSYSQESKKTAPSSEPTFTRSVRVKGYMASTVSRDMKVEKISREKRTDSTISRKSVVSSSASSSVLGTPERKVMKATRTSTSTSPGKKITKKDTDSEKLPPTESKHGITKTRTISKPKEALQSESTKSADGGKSLRKSQPTPSPKKPTNSIGITEKCASQYKTTLASKARQKTGSFEGSGSLKKKEVDITSSSSKMAAKSKRKPLKADESPKRESQLIKIKKVSGTSLEVELKQEKFQTIEEAERLSTKSHSSLQSTSLEITSEAQTSEETSENVKRASSAPSTVTYDDPERSVSAQGRRKSGTDSSSKKKRRHSSLERTYGPISLPSSPSRMRSKAQSGSVQLLTSEVFTRTIDSSGGIEIVFKQPESLRKIIKYENELSLIDTTDSSLSDSVALPLSSSEHDISFESRHRVTGSPISPKFMRRTQDVMSPKLRSGSEVESSSSDAEYSLVKHKSSPTLLERSGKGPRRVSEERLSPILDVRSVTPPRWHRTTTSEEEADISVAERSTSGEKISQRKPVDVTKIQSPVTSAAITQELMQELNKDEAIILSKNEDLKKEVEITEVKTPRTIKEPEVIKEFTIPKEIKKIDKTETVLAENQEIKGIITETDVKDTKLSYPLKKQDIKETKQSFDFKESTPESLTKQEIKQSIKKVDTKDTALPETIEKQESKEIITKSEVKVIAPEMIIPTEIKETYKKFDKKEVTSPDTVEKQKIKEIITKSEVKEIAPEMIIPTEIKETYKKFDKKEVTSPDTVEKQKIKEIITKSEVKEIAPEMIIPTEIKETYKKFDKKEVTSPDTVEKQKIKEIITKSEVKEIAPEMIIPTEIKETYKKFDKKEVTSPDTVEKQKIKEIITKSEVKEIAPEMIIPTEIKETYKKFDKKEVTSPDTVEKQKIKEIITKSEVKEIAPEMIIPTEIKETYKKFDKKEVTSPDTVEKQKIKEIITKSEVKEIAPEMIIPTEIKETYKKFDKKEVTSPDTVEKQKIKEIITKSEVKEIAPEMIIPTEIKETYKKFDKKEVTSPDTVEKQKIKEIITKSEVKVIAPEMIIPTEIKETYKKFDKKEVTSPDTVEKQKIKEIITKSEVKEIAPEMIIPTEIKETYKKIDKKEVTSPDTVEKQKIKEIITKSEVKEIAPEMIIPTEIKETYKKIDKKEITSPDTVEKQKIKEITEKVDIKETAILTPIIKKEIQETVTSKILETITAPEVREKNEIKETGKNLPKTETLTEQEIKGVEMLETALDFDEEDLKKKFQDVDRSQQFVGVTECKQQTDDVGEIFEGKPFIIEDREEECKPYVTTPTQSRRVSGIGGSQRLSREERPTVRIVTDFVEDSDSESESENYIVTEPTEKKTYPTRKGVKFRFDSEDYREDKASDDEIEEVIEEIEEEEEEEIVDVEEEPIITEEIVIEPRLTKTERRFERMASVTTGAETKASEGEFQRIISQMSTEEVNQALEQWDKGGMTPSEGDSKDTTTEGSSDHISPTMQEGSHTLEPEEHGETAPIPSPRTPIKPLPREISKEIPTPPSHKQKQETHVEDSQKFASKKMFWEQMSTGSIDETVLKKEQEPPIPKPRMSIPTSSVLAEISKEISYSDASRELEVSDIEDAESLKLKGAITTADVAHGFTKERTLSQDGDTNSEVEYIATHELEDLSYDNPAFSQEEGEGLSEIAVLPRTKKLVYERSASLPCDSSLDISSDNVRVKKRIFEAQIKKEMVVEQLMAQLEEESSPEHKSIGQKDDLPATDTQAMVSRQIHSDIFSKELDEQIESLIPESKDIYQDKTVDKQELSRKISSELSQESSQPLEEKSEEVSSESQSIYDPNLSSSVAEALQYKNDVISKPSDSLEVHVDKSEIEDTEKVKEIEEDLREMDQKEDSVLQMPEEFDKVKVSSITSSQGESEDTFSESDVTPEDARFREQQDIQVYGPTEKEMKLMPEKEDEQKKQRNVYTPEEHIPDTVWEVPVQEEIYSLQEVTVQQLPIGSSISLDESEITEKIRKESITESEAREIAEIIVEDIETKLIELPTEEEVTEVWETEAADKQGQITKKIHDAAELDTNKKSDTVLRYIRTDTTTSSMEITDEDLRSSGVDTDVSPLESQAGCVYPMSVRSGEESSDDVDNQELEHDLVGKEDLDKTLAEVRQSLEAVKEELIEEKKKKKDSITKESPSEFEFKVLSLEKTFSESIQECHHEEVSSSASTKKKVDQQETKVKKEDFSTSKATETTKTDEKITQEFSIKEEAVSESLKHDLKSRQEFSTEKSMSEESQTVSQSESITLSSKLSTSQEEKSEEKIKHTTLEKSEYETKEFTKEKSESLRDEVVLKDTSIILTEKTNEMSEATLQSDVQEGHEISETLISEIIEEDSRTIETVESQEVEIERGDDRKSPTQDDVTSASDSSEKLGGSDSAPTFDKPNIIIRKHKKSSVTIRPADPKSDYELYSSSGESHYHSFEQTSESARTPGSRPLSSDIEGLVPNLAGVTGSSEYESAISGQSTTMTSKDFHTAVSSLSSRDSMKSLDSESSGNLASVEVSSEASETLVPSAMELEKDMEPTGAVEPVDKPVITKSELRPKAQSFSESNDQSVSFDISAEEISEDEDAQIEQGSVDISQRMKRSLEMTFQPEPRPISEEIFPTVPQEEKYASSLDDMTSLVSSSDTGDVRTVIEVSRTESDRMDGSATSEQLSLTVSGTSELLSLTDLKDIDETTVINKVETTATQSPSILQQSTIESVTITTSSVLEQGIQSVCTQVTSKVSSLSHSNGPTQVEYNAEYDEGEPEVKKKGHRRNGSTSFRPSMVPVFYGKDLEKKKSEEISEDSAESDKYTESLTLKEGSQEEKKDIDEAERLEDEFYQTEADQGLHRDIREGRVILEDTYGLEELKDLDFAGKVSKSRLSSAAFSDDHADSELAELLKQCSTEVPSEDPIERPKTPEPVEECEIKDDTPEFSSEAQASVTELEMEYSGAFSRTSEYEAHISPIREKELLPQDLWEQSGMEQEEELAEAEAAFHTVSSQMLSSFPQSLLEEPIAEKHELETQESGLKEESGDRSKLGSSPVPDITVTQHMVPQEDSFEYPDDMEAVEKPETIISVSSKASSECDTDQGQEYVLDGYGVSSSSEQFRTQIAPCTQEKKEEEKDDVKEHDSNSESPTSDSFELLEKPDIADEFVIIEEVGREAQEQDSEGKGLKIGIRRVTPRSHTAPQKEEIISPPSTATKMTKLKYFGSGGAEEEIPFDFESGSPSKAEEKTEESSQEGSPPSAEEQDDFKPEVEAGKKWIEMQFQGEPVAQIYGYEIEYERGGPLEDIKEEDINDLESSSKIGSMGSQVSHSIGSFGSVKESLSSTPDYDVLAGRRFFTRSGEHDDVSMSSLQEFERLESLIALESAKHRSLGSQDSLTSSSNSRKHGSRSGGDDISLASLKEFEGLESACIAAERIEKKAKAEEESLLSEIEEGHESQASESESCVTVSVGAINRGESDEDDYEKRMFEIDEIIRQAQTNVESFMDAKSKELLDEAAKRESLARADSLEEISRVPDLDFDQPLYSVSYSSGKSYIQQWGDLGEDLLTSTDSLEMKTQISKISVDPFTTSADSLEMKMSQDVMSVSTDSIEALQKMKKKDVMTDSIEVGEKSSMITSTDSLEGKVTQTNSLDEEEQHIAGTHDQSSSSGKDGDLSSSGREDSAAEGAVGLFTNRMPPPRAEFLLGSTDSLEPTSSTATHATYQYETDSVMSSSFTSGDSTTMVDDNDEEAGARAAVWFDEGKPYVTEVIEPTIGDDDFSHMVHRTVEMPPEIHKVTFKGKDAEQALKQYIERFDPGEDISETREEDDKGNVHVKRVIQRRVIIRPEEMGGDTTDLTGPELEKYLKSLTDSKMGSVSPLLESVQISSSSTDSQTTTSTTITTKQWTSSQGDTIKTEQQTKETQESRQRGKRPPLKYDISVDEDPEFDPREHDWRFNLQTHLEGDEEQQEMASGFIESKSGSGKAGSQQKKK
ncbi:uncharacterized protein isoform X2 [Rhodnius prolixus]|uniref:uncharacterized protein isoform X2 n=1 Tax=Rhodnius prolixus TaxID=13249 RepID=UPI003D1883EB